MVSIRLSLTYKNVFKTGRSLRADGNQRLRSSLDLTAFPLSESLNISTNLSKYQKMRLFSLLTRCAMASFALAGSREQKASVGSWTVRNFARFCQNDGSMCMYTFGIEEDPDSCVFSPCVFTVEAAEGKPANQSDFQQVECPNMEWFTYKVNGGWDPRGYMTIVVTNTDRQADAYFSFQDEDIEKGQVVASMSSPAYHVGTFSKARGEIARRGSEAEEEIGAWWQIQDMLRRMFSCFPRCFRSKPLFLSLPSSPFSPDFASLLTFPRRS